MKIGREERYREILAWFAINMPSPKSELNYRNPFELLVAVILSAQCTDKRVNVVTPALFNRFPTPQAMSEASEAEMFEFISSISYPNNKSRSLCKMAKQLCENFGGEVPSDIDQLQTLGGVGRKTANVIGAVIFGKPTMAVDTHVFRVSKRIGLVVKAKTPLQTELQLMKYIPEEVIPDAHHWLILHGRYVCTARKPNCGECGISKWCEKFHKEQRAAARLLAKQNKEKEIISLGKR